jgi:hypothetical protein
METPLGAFIVLDGGPLDGAEIKWPNDGGDFPSDVQFSFYMETEPGKEFSNKREIRHYRYTASHGYGVGPQSQDDGLPEQEWQHYRFFGQTSEIVKSVDEMWDETD